MRNLLSALFLTAASSFAGAVTISETTASDGSHNVTTQILYIAFGPSKITIAIALFVFGAALCAAAVWLASQDKGAKPGTATQVSVTVPQKLTAKAFIGFHALLLIVGSILAFGGVALFVFEGIYGALI